MKKLLVLIVALMASLTLSAQEMRYGVTGGVNFAWMHNPISSSDAYIGFNAGVKAEMDLSSVVADGFYADARALYSLKGGRWSFWSCHLTSVIVLIQAQMLVFWWA